MALSYVLALSVSLFVASVVYGADPGLDISRPGGAGHALLFRDQILTKTDFKDFPSTELTFEAWISTSDVCHSGTILSYAKHGNPVDEEAAVADYNHFVIFDPRNLLACHDFKFIDLSPDPNNVSCHAAFKVASGKNETASYIERDGKWHHLAVTWSAAKNGTTNIYFDGLLMATAPTGKTEPLVSDGALILGGEQDCFAGCTDPLQGYYGLMDEIRIWKVERTQEEIIRHMRWANGLENSRDLVAYWKFNDPDTDDGQFRRHLYAKDSSGKGNDLLLENIPFRSDVTIKQDGHVLETGALEFKNNVAINKDVHNMPSGSFTVEFWAKGAMAELSRKTNSYSQFFSYATQRPGGETGVMTPVFMDDAIRVERWLVDVSMDGGGLVSQTNTRGSVRVHVNSNENTDSSRSSNWIQFDAQWMTDEWHHVAVTWDQLSGNVALYVNGKAKTPFWKSDRGIIADKAPADGGVDPSLNKQSARLPDGSLVIGQDQDCFGGCFSPSNSLNGFVSVMRVWNRVLTGAEVAANMWRTSPDTTSGLVSMYTFEKSAVEGTPGGLVFARDAMDQERGNKLELRSNPPLFVYSTAPLTMSDGSMVLDPVPGAAGTALKLHDRQVLLLPNFQDFPSTAITVEFWMYSVDTCNPGVPFSYAHGSYERQDNSFLIFDYNSWGVSVMEDEGTVIDHKSGVSATDGNWHHVAVTWESSTGRTVLYDNGRAVWVVTRGQGQSIPSGGTLVIGREQDCLGGCFDSSPGAVGRLDPTDGLEYGAQDFFGTIEEMRVWRVARTPEQIRAGMDSDDGHGPGGFQSPGWRHDDPDLVAYWKFDEGGGYMVKDVTGHGHDLIITQKPTWEVVRWLSTCGNGAVEGAEECDDGNNRDGDGCSASCRVEAGWTCSVTGPSSCTKGGSGGTRGSQVSGGDGGPAPSGGGSGTTTHKSGGSTVLVVMLVLLISALLVGGVYFYRHAIFEHFPQVESGVAHVGHAVARLLPGGSNNKRTYNNLGIDPEELDISPEFLNPTPARVPPGHPGPYSPFVDLSTTPRPSDDGRRI